MVSSTKSINSDHSRGKAFDETRSDQVWRKDQGEGEKEDNATQRDCVVLIFHRPVGFTQSR